MPDPKASIMTVRRCIVISILVVIVGLIVGWFVCKATEPPPPPPPRIVRFLPPSPTPPPIEVEQEKPGDPDPVTVPVHLDPYGPVLGGSIDEASTAVTVKIHIQDPVIDYEVTRELTKMFVEYYVSWQLLPDGTAEVHEWLGQRDTEEDPWEFVHYP